MGYKNELLYLKVKMENEVKDCHVIYIYFVKLQSILKVLSNKFATVSRRQGRFNLNCQLLQTLWCIPH